MSCHVSVRGGGTAGQIPGADSPDTRHSVSVADIVTDCVNKVL